MADEIATADARDAARYRFLRERDLDTIRRGGVFVGLVPDNLVINQGDLDRRVDEAMAADAMLADAGPLPSPAELTQEHKP